MQIGAGDGGAHRVETDGVRVDDGTELCSKWVELGLIVGLKTGLSCG